jgi:hypothetical protein
VTLTTSKAERKPFTDPNRRREPPPEPVVIEVNAATLASYAGTYELGARRSVYVKYSDGTLLGSSDGLDWAELLAERETRFFVRGEDIRIVFVRNETGEVTELILLVEGGPSYTRQESNDPSFGFGRVSVA